MSSRCRTLPFAQPNRPRSLPNHGGGLCDYRDIFEINVHVKTFYFEVTCTKIYITNSCFCNAPTILHAEFYCASVETGVLDPGLVFLCLSSRYCIATLIWNFMRVVSIDQKSGRGEGIDCSPLLQGILTPQIHTSHNFLP